MVEIDHPERLLPLGWHRTEGGVFSDGPQPGRLVMLDFDGRPRIAMRPSRATRSRPSCAAPAGRTCA